MTTLAKFAKTQPQAAYAAFTHGLSSKWKAASTAGKGMPRPPRRVGRAKIFLSNADMDFLPIRAGMKVVAMASSRGCSISEMSWIVLKK